MRIRALLGGILLTLSLASSALADGMEQIRAKGQLRLAVYNNFPPFSYDGKGIDVDLAHALAERMGLKADVGWYEADENMDDDLRNIVWKGHYLNGRTADVMLHVPVDEVLIKNNDKVKIFAPYQKEQIAIARNVSRVPTVGGAAGLEVFTREKIGVEIETISDAFLGSAFGGRLRENVVHFRTVALATQALKEDKVSAVMAPLSELEAGLGKSAPPSIKVSVLRLREMSVNDWNLGVAVKAGNDDLAAAVAKAMQALREDGTVARIFEKYGVTYASPGS